MRRSTLFLISAMVLVAAVRGILVGNVAPSIFAQQGSSGNLAAATSGGAIIAYSSEYTPGWEATNLIDGDYTKGWGTNTPVASGQWIVVRLPGEAPAMIREIRINPV